MESPSSNLPFASELVRLLVQVAWADHDVAEAEAAALVGFAQRQGIAGAELAALRDMLSGRAPLSPPNLGLLKPRRTEVLRAVKQLLESDLKVAEEEEQILGQIAELLG